MSAKIALRNAQIELNGELDHSVITEAQFKEALGAISLAVNAIEKYNE